MNYIGNDMTVSTLRGADGGGQVWRVRTKDGRSAEFATDDRRHDPADLFRLARKALGDAWSPER